MFAKIQKFLKGSLMVGLLALLTYSVLLREGVLQAVTSRSDLQNYSRNLDILADKPGNLDQLIGELQGQYVFTTTGAVVGTTITVPGILPTDTVEHVTVYSSAAFVAGSTVIGKAGDGQIQLQSKIWGDGSFKLNFSIVQQEAGNVSSQTLSINTTGYAFTIKLASGSNNTVISSANAIVDAINAHAYLSKIVKASTLTASTSFSTASFKMSAQGGAEDFTSQSFHGNSSGGAEKSYRLTLATTTVMKAVYELPGNSVVITSSGCVQVSTATIIQKEDALAIHVRGKRD